MPLVQHPNFAAVRMLCHFDGTLGDVAGTPMFADGTSFVAGAAGWGQAVSIGGTNPGGGGPNVVYSAPTAALDLSGGDITLEARMLIGSHQSRPRYAICVVDAATGRAEFTLGIEPDGLDMKWVVTARNGASTDAVISASSVPVSIGATHHAVLAKKGSGIRLLADGAVLGTVDIGAYQAPAGAKIAYIGNSARSWIDALDGTIDEACITAACLYWDAYSPPEGPYANFWPVSARPWPGGVHTV